MMVLSGEIQLQDTHIEGMLPLYQKFPLSIRGN